MYNQSDFSKKLLKYSNLIPIKKSELSSMYHSYLQHKFSPHFETTKALSICT